MKRRDFVTRAVSGGLLGSTLAACASKDESGPAVRTKPSVTWRLTSSFPRGLDTIYGSAEILAERVLAMSEGKFRIQAYPAGEIVPGLQVLDAVQQGTVHVGQTVSYYFTGKNPALAFDACVPFGLTSRQQTAWLYDQGGLDLMRELFSDFNIICFPGGNTGTQMGGWFKREIHGQSDLSGLKIRIPGLGGEVMSRLGAVVQVLAGGDIFPALERGAIDATEWVGPYDDEKLGFHKVAKYYYYPGWWEPGPNLSFYVNQGAWDKLPADYQAIFDAATREAGMAMQSRYDARNPAAMARLIEAGVQVRPFADDIMEAARTASAGLLEELAAGDATYRRVFDQWKKARQDAYRWFSTAELAFASYSYPRG